MIRIFIAELRKLMLPRGLLILAAAAAAGLVWSLLPSYREFPCSPEVYAKYTAELEGELTEPKAGYLRARLEETDRLLEAYGEMRQRYLDGELTLEEYSAFTERHGTAKAERETVDYLCRRCETLLSCSGFEPYIFNDTDWSGLLAGIGFDPVMLLALLCLTVPVFDREYSSGSIALLLTSKRGRGSLAAVKVLTAAAAAFCLSLMLSGIRLGIFACRSGLGYGSLAAGNVLLTDSLGDTSLIEYYAFDSLLRGAVYALYGAGICLVCVICRNTVFTFVLSFIICAAPVIAAGNLTGTASAYLLPGTLTVRMYPAGLSIPGELVICALHAAAIMLMTVRIWRKRRKRA
ncbi:MAG: hypothetical protein IKP47_05990 [Ruminococcus sp.]|nr:hypothetical protein [Ruminococcus sp.]